MLMFSLAVPIAVVENCGGIDAMKRSAKLTEGYRWRIFGTLFVFWLIITGFSFLMNNQILGTSSEIFISVIIKVLTIQLLNSASIIIALFIYLGILAASNAPSVEVGRSDSTINQAR